MKIIEDLRIGELFIIEYLISIRGDYIEIIVVIEVNFYVILCDDFSNWKMIVEGYLS